MVGGGSAGCTIGAKLSSKLGEGKVIILEPADVSAGSYSLYLMLVILS